MFEIILGTALLILFLAFWTWHSPWARKLTKAEIDHYMAILEKLPLHTFPGAPEFQGSPQESNAYYMKRLRRLWLSHAAYPIFDGVPQSENLINMQPERTWGQVTVVRYPNRHTLLRLVSDPAYAPVEPYKFMAMELDLVPVAGRIVMPDLRWLLGGGFVILFLLVEWVRAVWLR